MDILVRPVANPLWDTVIQIVILPIHWLVEKRQEGSGWVMNWMEARASFGKTHCSTTGKPTRSFATERVSLDSV